MRENEELIENLSDRFDEFREAPPKKDDETFRQKYREFKNDSIAIQKHLDNTLNELDAHFRMVKGLKQNSSEKLTKVIKPLAKRWQKTVRPNLLNLKEECHRIEMDIAQIKSP